MKTANERQIKRSKKIKDAGLHHNKVIAHKDDYPEIKRLAVKLYTARGITL